MSRMVKRIREPIWLDNESRDAVETFWRLSGDIEPFPRNLEFPLALALPVALVKLPRLHLESIERWLMSRGARFRFGCPSRQVRGCLLAHGGIGMIFIDGADSTEERRFTLAHEIAHFLIDYWNPRQKAILRFGEGILEALDGYRSLSLDERVHSILSGTRIGPYTRLIERDDLGLGSDGSIWIIENRADKIAVSLLAPVQEVIRRIDSLDSAFNKRKSNIVKILKQVFGLPEPVASAYAHSLLNAIAAGPSWLEGIGLR
jgi:hypothetical protein